MEYHYIEKRYNVIGLSSIDAFAGIKGGMNGNCKDVYFLRMTGVSGTFARDVERMDAAQTQKMRLGQGIYNRAGAFPRNLGADQAAVYAQCCEKWIGTGRRELFTRRLGEESGAGELLGISCGRVLEMYRRSNPHVNDSIERNFVVKLLYWLDELAYDYLREWNPRQSMKFVAQGVVKEQEYFFCYFLTLLGIDVLLLQNEADIDERLDRLNLSRKLVLGEMGAAALEAYDRKKYETAQGGGGGISTGGAGQNQNQEAAERRPRVVIPPRRGTAGNAAGTPGGAIAGRNGVSGGAAVNPGSTEPGRSGVLGRTAGAPGGAAPGSAGAGRSGVLGGVAVNSSGAAPGSAGAAGRSGAPGRTAGIPGGAAPGSAAPAGSGMSGTAGAERRELDFEQLARLASSVVMIAIHDRKGDVIGSGSGIMIGREGYILTNNHVASGGKFYSVRIENDDNAYETDEIIKYNSLLDLAVIRIDRKLDPLPVYRGKKPLVRGQKVVAIGSPLGLFNSVSDGIISGFRRMNDVDMIQFTAPTSHGSSGGALLNMYGEVIGVSTAGIDEGQNINLAVGCEFINTFVRGFQ